MNNEPVAWMSSVGGEFVYVGYEPAEGYLAIPLYTHPANEYKPNQTLECSFNLAGFKPPAKTLTDEEILFMCDDHRNKYGGIEPIGFARAILKKAQEK